MFIKNFNYYVEPITKINNSYCSVKRDNNNKNFSKEKNDEKSKNKQRSFSDVYNEKLTKKK